MPPRTDETRRSFLLRLAAVAAFVPPAMVTLDVRPLLAQGKGSSGKGASSTVGSMSPTAAAVSQPIWSEDQITSPTQVAPWDAAGPAQIPPWSRPPPGGSSGH